MKGHALDPVILRAYDIRGVVGETLSAVDMAMIGRGFGTLVRQQGGDTVYVGRDGRLSSPDFEVALISGLVEAGLRVRSIGVGPTPMLYFATRFHEGDAGIMITGSHNPPTHNGVKMMLGTKPFHGPQIQALGRLIAAADFTVDRIGEVLEIDVRTAYADTVAAAFTGRDDLTVVWDPGNGAAGAVLGEVLKRLPGQHIILNEAVDGTFPNHHPDPTVVENLVQLQAAVAAHKADIGIAFDGDGDRIGAVDARGRIIWGDQILALLAREVLAERPGATIIADVKASRVLFDEIARLGGTPLMWRTGHSPIKEKMAELGAPLAGEMSGHIFFADKYYGYDDALYVGVRLLNAIGGAGQSIGDFLDSLPATLSTPEIRIEVPEERKFAIVTEVAERLSQAGAAVTDIDGVRVTTAEGWWLMRASNTQNALTLRCEGSDEAGLATLKAALAVQLEQSGVAVDLG